MKLYYLSGSCALGPHIALEHCGLAHEAIRIERGKQTDAEYLAVNPLGRVPALVTENHSTLTEAPVILTYIADLARDHRLLPPVGAFERYEALRWMAFISSTVHPAIGRLWRAERFCDTDACRGSVEHAAATQLANDFAYIEENMHIASGWLGIIRPSRISICSCSEGWACDFPRTHGVSLAFIAIHCGSRTYRPHNVR